MTAEFVNKDTSKHDSEDDALPYTWETFANAIKKIKDGPESEYNGPRFEAIDKVIKLQSDKKKLSLEDW